MIRRLAVAACSLSLTALAACGLVTSTNRSVFFVFDVSGTYVKSVPDATKIANITVAKLLPGDWVGASQISIAITWKPQRVQTSSGTGCFTASVLITPSRTAKHDTAPVMSSTAASGIGEWPWLTSNWPGRR